jgi:hypothetical protein
MDMTKISFCITNQNPVVLYHILDDASVKLTLFQSPTVVDKTQGPQDCATPRLRSDSLVRTS